MSNWTPTDLKTIPFSRRASLACLYEAMAGNALELVFARFENFGQRERSIEEIAPTDAQGNLLAFSVEFTPYVLTLHLNARPPVRVVIQSDSVAFQLPDGVGLQLYFSGSMLNFVRHGAAVRGTDSRPLMHYLLRSSGAMVLKWRSRKEGRSVPRSQIELLVPAEPGVRTFELCFSELELEFQEVQPFEAMLHGSRSAWEAWITAAPEVAPEHRTHAEQAHYALYTSLLPQGGRLTFEASSPSKANFYGVWPWDACFQALGIAHVDIALAQNQIRLLLDNQLDSGMLPDIVHQHSIKATCTKPPIEAWTAWRLYERSHDLAFLADIYPRLCKVNRWWRERRDYDGDGVCQYDHYWDGGWDNSPIFLDRLPVEAPDLNAHLAVQMERLARMAGELGLEAERLAWRHEARLFTSRFVEHSFDQARGFFQAPKDGGHTFVETLTLGQLFPLVMPELEPVVVNALATHLLDKRKFWGRFKLPTVAYDDPNYKSGTYWSGAIWVNVAYMLVEGLALHGYTAEAEELRDAILDLVVGSPGLRECYDSRSGEGLDAQLFGWTAAIFIDLAVKKHQGELI